MARNAAATRNTYSWTSSTAFFNRPSKNGSTRWSGPPRRPRQSQLGVAQAFDLVADRRRLLEIEIRGGRLHLVLQRRHVGIELGLRTEPVGLVADDGRRHVIALVDARHHLVDLLHDGLRRDAMLLVVRLLQRPPSA